MDDVTRNERPFAASYVHAFLRGRMAVCQGTRLPWLALRGCFQALGEQV